MGKIGKALRNVLIVGIPLVIVAAIVIAIYNSNLAKYGSIIQSTTGQLPSDAQTALLARLHLQGGNKAYTLISIQHASNPANHWNPMVNTARDMWCVVVDPPSDIRVIDQGDRPLRSFLVYQTRSTGRWLVTDGIEVFQTDQKEFQQVGCTNYQH